MCLQVAAVFDSPHLLTLMRTLGEQTEMLVTNSLPPTAPLREPLVQQLTALEGDPSRWRQACEPYLLARVYTELDGMDKYLQTRMDELRRAQTQKGVCPNFHGLDHPGPVHPPRAPPKAKRARLS